MTGYIRTSATGVPITVEFHIARVANVLEEEASAFLSDPLDAATALFEAAAIALGRAYAPGAVAAMLKAIGTVVGEKVVSAESRMQ